MFTMPGIAKADDLDPFTLLVNNILPARAGHIGTLGTEEFGRRLGPAGRKEYQWDKPFHAASMGQLG